MKTKHSSLFEVYLYIHQCIKFSFLFLLFLFWYKKTHTFLIRLYFINFLFEVKNKQDRAFGCCNYVIFVWSLFGLYFIVTIQNKLLPVRFIASRSYGLKSKQTHRTVVEMLCHELYYGDNAISEKCHIYYLYKMTWFLLFCILFYFSRGIDLDYEYYCYDKRQTCQCFLFYGLRRLICSWKHHW